MASRAAIALLSLFFVTIQAQLDMSVILDLIQNNLGPPDNVTITEDDVSFSLYSHTYNGTIVTRKNLFLLDPSFPTVFILHGWSDSGNSSFFGTATKAYLSIQDHNIIAVDYSGPAAYNYSTSAALAKDVGLIIAEFISDAHNYYGLKLDTLTLVGHSLGGQVIGYAGKYVQELTGGKIARLIGLDPAGPLFASDTEYARHINSEDGVVVQCIITNSGLFGTSLDICDVNFFPHNGRTQPGCSGVLDVGCNHMRAVLLYLESITKPNGFVALRCNSWTAYIIGTCRNGNVKTLGGNFIAEDRGNYFFTTNDGYPYSLN